MDEYIGIIKIFVPGEWAFCHGQLSSTAQHQTLFSIMGNTYAIGSIQSMDGRMTYSL